MASSLDNSNVQNNNMRNNNQTFIQQFQNFKNQLGGTDPKKIVMDMLNTGRMSKQQFQQFSNIANSFMRK